MAAARWSPVTKRIVVLLLLAIAVYVIYRAGDIVRPFLWAAVLSYVLLPLVRLIEVRVTHHRGAAAAIVFLALLALIIGGARLLVPLALAQMTMFQRSLPNLIANAQNTLVGTLDQLGMTDLHPIVVGPGGLAPVDFTRNAANFAVPVVVGFGHFLLEFLVLSLIHI